MKHTTLFVLDSGLTLMLFLSFLAISISQDDLQTSVDQLLISHYPIDNPGAAAIITKDGEVIYRNAFGKANLELGVDMTPDNIFEIGSITKQFTAVCILKLMEEGKLDLTDEITKYLPEYPTQGYNITVHHLLNHTSGIKSYTSMPSFINQARKDLEPKELIDVFKNEAMDFAPGESYLYNNSAYIILGYIIEEIAGVTYEDYVEKELFTPAGMANSRYGHKEELVPMRASGYQPSSQGFENADYLSMTLPYAAGSLMSTVDDLAKWQLAMNENKFITEDSKQLAWSNYSLNDGSAINYGYGWAPNDVNGTLSIEHGGGIFGYTTMGVYIPSEDIYVALLTNSNGTNPSEIAVKMAAIALENPYPSESTLVSLSKMESEKWIGSYKFDDGAIRFITVEDGHIFSQRVGSERLEIYPTSPNSFFFEGGLVGYEFSEGNSGKKVVFKNRIESTIGVESDIAPPAPKKEISLAPDLLKTYNGSYELQPNFLIKVTARGNQIFAQATGQPEFELFAESEDHFFLKVVPASIDFEKDNNGKVVRLTLNQNGMNLKGKKIE